MDIQPLAGALGAEIRGIDLTRLGDAGWRDVHKAFLEYSVLAIRDQRLEPADLMHVGAHFGEPCYYPFVTGLDGFPYIFEVVKAEEEKTALHTTVKELNAQIEKLKKRKAQLPRELQSIVDRLATSSATASNQVSKLSEAQEAVAAAVSKHRDESHEGRAGH
jgi:alpha-ketoglutarate-dependent taurine dioxygenase